MKFAVGVLVLVVLGCGPGLSKARKASLPGAWTDDFVEAIRDRDLDELEALLVPGMFYAGLYFPDPECAKQFPTPRKLEQPMLAAFARCLATLPIKRSGREDAVYGVAVLEYDPGIELEAVFQFRGSTSRVTWIGYSGRRNLQDGLPTITTAALEAIRVEGDPTARPTPEEAQGIDAENKVLELDRAFAWFKVCLDAEGNVTGVHEREVTSSTAARAFAGAIQKWKFRPFTVGTQALPACSLVLVSHPHEKASPEVLPVMFPLADGMVRIPPKLAKRLSGEKAITPDDDDKVAMQRARGGTITSTFSYCFDASGKVAAVSQIEPSGLPGYDRKIQEAIKQWTFRPYVRDGKPVTACTAVTFIYTQR